MASPVKLKNVFSLLTLGVSPQSLTFNTATVSSYLHIAVRESGSNLLILDTRNPTNPLRRPSPAEAALVHPTHRIIALRNGLNIKIFNIDKQGILNQLTMTESVVYWKWISGNVLALVTPTAVYHWNVKGEQDIVKVFDRHASLGNCQIIGYVVEEKGKWCCVVGIQRGVTGLIEGRMQLYSVQKKLSQALEGHAAAFARIRFGGKVGTLFVFAGKRRGKEEEGEGKWKMHVVEVETEETGVVGFEKVAEEMFFPPEFPKDYPLSITWNEKYPTMLYLISKAGFVHVYDVLTALCLYQNRISTTTCFATVPHSPSGGLMTLNREGSILLFAPDPEHFVEYVTDKLGNQELADSIASYNGFAGADNTFVNRFEDAMDDNDYQAAAVACCDSPGGVLRNEKTLTRLRNSMQDKGAPPPILIYLQTCLERGPLNEVESIELGKVLLKSDRLAIMEKWVLEEKLYFSEQLGDLLRQSSPKMAMAIFIKCKAHQKVIETMIQTGNHSKVAQYAAKVGMDVDHLGLVDMAAKYDAKAALSIANNSASNALVLRKSKPTKVDVQSVQAVVDTFLAKGMLSEAVSYAMENLRDQDTAEARLQTKLLELCLKSQPQVADAILSQDIWHQYNEIRIAILCERAGLYQHALENFKDLADVKRVIANTHVINPKFLLNYFATIDPEDATEVLEELLRTNPRGNIRLAVTVATKYTESWGGAAKVMKIFERFVEQVPDSLYYYLASVVLVSSESEVHNRFVEVAVKLGQFGDAEKITRESVYIDPDRLKRFLMNEKCRDPRPLMNICDRFDFIPALVKYLVNMNQITFVEGYVQRVNPTKCPEVIGALLDLDAMDAPNMEKLIISVKNMVPVEAMVEVVEERGKLRLIHKFLESRLADGSTEEPVHTGIAKVYVDTNTNPAHFLQTNSFYDSLKVGKYCARRDPYLAYIAFARGKCDDELLEVTNDNSLFKEQARYVTDRAEDELWAKVLKDDNPFRKLVQNQVVSTALPETKEPSKIAAAVKAFLKADMPEVLMELLEKLVLQTANTAFSRNSNLQNLLILTAIKSNRSRVMEYIRRLDNYDGEDIAPSCEREGLFEEAYTVYYKFEKYDEAVDILITKLKNFDRANEFAIRINTVEVWLKLGVAELEEGIVADGVMCLLRARNVDRYALVCMTARDHAETDEDFKMVVKFCKVGRKKLRKSEHALKLMDAELVYSLCRLNKLTEVEEFIVTENHLADLDEVGDRCFADENFVACKLLFSATSNWPKLAHTCIKLGEYKEAVDAAKKAKRIPTWRIVCFGCVDAEEFKLASIGALKLLVEVEEMQECVEYYEDRGHFGEIIMVMEAGLSSDRAHEAMYTEFVVLLTKYQESRVFDAVRVWHAKLNIQRAIRACQRSLLWDIVVYLFVQYNEFENATMTMMEHSATAFDHSQFLDVIARAGVLELYYKSITFYVDEQPSLISDLLRVLAPRVDATRAVRILKSSKTEFGSLGFLPFVTEFLVKVQEADMPEVNEAANDLFVREENVEALQRSVDNYRNFHTLELAKRLEDHNLLDMRRIASHLFARSGRHERAIEIAKDDKLYADIIYAIKESKDEELAEMYATWFIEEDLQECFTALLFECYEFFAPDVAMEYAWKGELRDLAMPFMIQTVGEAGQRLTSLEEERKVAREKEEEAKKEEDELINEDVSVLLYGLQPQHQQLLIDYGQTDGMGGLASQGYFQRGSAVPLIGWNGPQTGALTSGFGNNMADPIAAYNTFAIPQQQAGIQQAYQTNAIQQQQMMQQQAYMTNVAQQQHMMQAAYMTQAT